MKPITGLCYDFDFLMNERKMCRLRNFVWPCFLVSKYFPSISCIWHIIINLDVDVLLVSVFFFFLLIG